MNKQEVINCNDGQALADAVAVEVMGWTKHTYMDECLREPEVSYRGENNFFIMQWDWQPHLRTEKGRAQCWDLMVKYGLTLVLIGKGLYTVEDANGFEIIVALKEKPQIAVLKAALLSVRSE